MRNLWLCGEKEQTLWDVMSPLHQDEKEKDKSFRSSRQKVFYKKGVLRNFTKFTGEHLCQSLFFNKVAGLVKFLRTPFLTKSLRATSSKV